jgi:hypothetical protein
MMEQRNLTDVSPAVVPSMARLMTATLVALIVAAAVLVVFVLPAEYGIDPLGTGRRLGLSDLAKASEKPAPAPGSDEAAIMPVLVPSPNGEAPSVRGTFIAQPTRYQIDSREMTLAAGEGMEIKYNMKKGAGLVYSWTANGILQFEFHGEPNVKPAGSEGTDYYESYELDDQAGKDQSNGTFVAPTTGIHGWFWQNMNDKPVTLKLVSAGFYDWILENRKDKETALKPMDAYALPGHPAVPDQAVR